MFKGTDIAYIIFKKYIKRPILYIFDPDVDGLIAGFLFCRFLEACGLEYSYYINDNRKHGLLLDIESLNGYLVLCSDFSIDDDKIEKIKNLDIALVCIDHHDIGNEFKSWDKGVVINNQYGFEPEEKRYLSGAGVVFEVLCCWNSNFDTIENRALVGITLLSDVRPIEDREARDYLRCTYNMDTSKGYFKYLVENTIKSEFGFGEPRMDRNFIDFTFSPRINSMLRFNESYEAVEFILGRGMKTEDKRELQKEYTEYLIRKASIIEYTHINIAIINKEDLNDYSNIEPANFIGLACSRIKDGGKDTVIALYEDVKLLRGSFRGKYDGIDYLDIFRRLNSVAFGHKGAFGIHKIDLSEENIDKINRGIGVNERGYRSTIKIIEVENLSMFFVNRARKVAEMNNYVRDQYRTYVKYTGTNIQVIRESEKYIEYLIDGNKVKCFDKNLDTSNGLLLPILDRGYVQVYLKELNI